MKWNYNDNIPFIIEMILTCLLDIKFLVFWHSQYTQDATTLHAFNVLAFSLLSLLNTMQLMPHYIVYYYQLLSITTGQ